MALSPLLLLLNSGYTGICLFVGVLAFGDSIFSPRNMDFAI